MNKATALKRKTSRMIAKNLIILFVLLVVAFVGVMSWFTQNTTATAEGISVQCDAPDGVEIAIVEHDADVKPEELDYQSTITLNSGEGVLEKLDFVELTSDGVTFKRPALNQENGVAKPTNSSEWSTATPGAEYICFDLYMRTKSQKSIYLSSTSNFDTVATRLSWSDSATVTDSDNASTYGNFSRDAIVGATRVSVLSYDVSSKSYINKKLLWVTRPDICLTQTGSEYSLVTGITKAQNSTYGSYYHYYCNEDTLLTSFDNDAVASVLADDGSVTLGEDIPITEFSAETDGAVFIDKYWYVHVVYNTWIEGEDNEARLALSDGNFKINLKLIAKND